MFTRSVCWLQGRFHGWLTRVDNWGARKAEYSVDLKDEMKAGTRVTRRAGQSADWKDSQMVVKMAGWMVSSLVEDLVLKLAGPKVETMDSTMVGTKVFVTVGLKVEMLGRLILWVELL